MARTIETYKREQAILNKVLESSKGLVATFNSGQEARNFRLNCWAFRKLDRDIQSAGLEPTDPKRGSSPYDLIKLELVTNYKTKTFQVIMKNCKTVLQAHGIESLIDLEDEIPVAINLSAPVLSAEETRAIDRLIAEDSGETLEDEMQEELEKENR